MENKLYTPQKKFDNKNITASSILCFLIILIFKIKMYKNINISLRINLREKEEDNKIDTMVREHARHQIEQRKLDKQ